MKKEFVKLVENTLVVKKTLTEGLVLINENSEIPSSVKLKLQGILEELGNQLGVIDNMPNTMRNSGPMALGVIETAFNKIREISDIQTSTGIITDIKEKLGQLFNSQVVKSALEQAE